ncbi:MAG: YncE family protein [Candidatus Aegiribacteria sp.]|nr:YncE family protein [Candidatus Aegiribacteria sp.]
MRTILIIFLSVTVAFLFACGNSTGPSGSDLTPSILSVNFTGHNCKNSSNAARATLSEDVSASVSSTESKITCTVTVFWTICCDQNFNSYVLYRSENADISSDPSSAVILGEFTLVNTSIFVDDGVTWGTEYYYALKTTGDDGKGVWSNEESLLAAVAPAPSVLSVEVVAWYEVDLSWTKCSDPSFESYRLYRSITPDIENDSTLAEVIRNFSSPGDTTYTDIYVNPLSTCYYYAIRTTTTELLSSWSNEVTVNTMSYIPYIVTETLDVGSNPWGICSLPTSDFVYVTNSGDNSVSIIRTSDNSVTAAVTVGDTPYGICALPSGEYVYVTNWGSDDVSVIRTSDNTVVTTVEVGSRPLGICTLPSGGYVYVTNRYDNNVYVIRTSDNSVVAIVEVGTNPYQICSLPSGEYVYVTNNYSNSVSVIRTSDNSVVNTVDMNSPPTGICALPSGEYVYISNISNDVTSVLRTFDNTVVATVSVGGNPLGNCSYPTGNCVYVANSTDNTVSLVLTSDNKEAMVLDVGACPSSICSIPSGEFVYVVNNYDNTVSVIE